MKKILTTILAASMMLIGTSAFAQFSIGGGFTNASTKLTVLNAVDLNPISSNGFFAGVSYNLPIGTSGLGIAPGLYYVLATKTDADLYVMTADFTEMYLQVPVDLNFKVAIADGLNGLIYGGPTFAYGLSSKAKAGNVVYDIYDGQLSNWTNYKRFDVLAGGGIGVEFEDIVRFTVGYDFGLMERGGSTIGIKRNQLNVGVSFLF